MAGDRAESCSFCGKPAAQAGKLIAGPAGVGICDACVSTCGRLLDREKSRARLKTRMRFDICDVSDEEQVMRVVDAVVRGCAPVPHGHSAHAAPARTLGGAVFLARRHAPHA